MSKQQQQCNLDSLEILVQCDNRMYVQKETTTRVPPNMSAKGLPSERRSSEALPPAGGCWGSGAGANKSTTVGPVDKNGLLAELVGDCTLF